MKDLFELINALSKDDIIIRQIDSAYKIEIVFTKADEFRAAFTEYIANNPQIIPKKIHQVWIGSHSPPWKWINSFKIDFMNHFPDWEYKLWRENDIADIKLINKDLYNAETILAGTTDILRYELLYQFGGIYIDADSEWLNKKSFDDLISNTNSSGLFAGKEDDVMIAASVIGSSVKNPLTYLLIKSLRLTFNETRISKKYPPWIASGPRFLSETIKYFEITKFPQHFFYPISWLQNNCSIDTSQFPESYMIQYGYTTNNLQKFL